MVVLNNREDRENRVKCKIAGQRIGNTRSTKFLGVIIDSKLKFNEHLMHVQGRALKAMNILRMVCRVAWGMEVGAALQVYKSYVRAILEYGLFVYFPGDIKRRLILERIHNRGIRIAGYRNSTPINVMIAEAKIVSIKDRAELIARNYWTKIVSGRNKEMISRMNRLCILDLRDWGAVGDGRHVVGV